jgi:hypothetical protein
VVSVTDPYGRIPVLPASATASYVMHTQIIMLYYSGTQQKKKKVSDQGLTSLLTSLGNTFSNYEPE